MSLLKIVGEKLPPSQRSSLEIYSLFCLVHIIKRSFLTSCVFGFVHSESNAHLQGQCCELFQYVQYASGPVVWWFLLGGLTTCMQGVDQVAWIGSPFLGPMYFKKCFVSSVIKTGTWILGSGEGDSTGMSGQTDTQTNGWMDNSWMMDGWMMVGCLSGWADRQTR